MMLCLIFLGNKFAVDLLKCDQSDESILAIGKKLRCLMKNVYSLVCLRS